MPLLLSASRFTTDQAASAIPNAAEGELTERQIEIQMLDALDECPNCLKPKGKFRSPPIFREHVQHSRCQFEKNLKFTLPHDARECPKCLVPRSDFEHDYLFIEHVRGDICHVGEAVAGLEECPTCSKSITAFASEMSFYMHIKNYCGVRVPVPVQIGTQPASDPEHELLEDLEECPNCLKSLAAFGTKWSFYRHIQHNCGLGPDQPQRGPNAVRNPEHELLADLVECPGCLKRRSDYSSHYAFYTHIMYWCSSPGQAGDAVPNPEHELLTGLEECPNCLRPAANFAGQDGFSKHVMYHCHRVSDNCGPDALLEDLDDCPMCLKPRTDFSRKSDFFTHVKTGSCRWGPYRVV